tara:strand:- start:720 stop:1811 length:1092 start_codon:yes stop_codon:yes gene_type:complete
VTWEPEPVAASYKVMRALSLGGPYNDISGSVTFDGTRATDATVAGGTTYYYQVVATNGAGDSSTSAINSATVPNFSVSGLTFDQAIGSIGTANGQLQLGGGTDRAGGVFVSGGLLYVTDWNNNRLQRFSATTGVFQDWLGFVSSTWGYYTSGTSSPPTMYSPLQVDGSGNVYAVQATSSGIKKFSSTGAFLSDLPIPMANFRRFTLDSSGNLFVQGSVAGNTIEKYDSAGSLLTSFAGLGAGSGQLNNSNTTADVVVDSAGNVYALDVGGKRLQRYDNTGAFVSSWPVEINGYSYLAIDETDKLYVVEDFYGTLRQYSTSGVLLAERTIPGGVVLGGGTSIFVQGGKVYLSNSNNHEVRVYSF